jgi:hypothetical protein
LAPGLGFTGRGLATARVEKNQSGHRGNFEISPALYPTLGDFHMHEETNTVNTETPADYRVNPDEDIIDDIQAVLNNPSTSDWLKWALRSSLHRDPVDATNDAVMLEKLLQARLELILQQACKEAC